MRRPPTWTAAGRLTPAATRDFMSGPVGWCRRPGRRARCGAAAGSKGHLCPRHNGYHR